MNKAKQPFDLRSIAEFMRLMRRNWWISLAVFIGNFASIAIFIATITPRYEAAALVQISPTAGLELSDARSKLTNASDPVLLRTETEILLSDQICLDVIEALALGTNEHFTSHNGEKRSSIGAILKYFGGIDKLTKPIQIDQEDQKKVYLLGIYRAGLAIYNDGRSTLARVAFSSSDPHLASRIANAHARVYLSSRVERHLENTDVSESKVISRALTPVSPNYPRTSIYLIASFIVSLFFGAIAAFGVERFRNRVVDESQVATRLAIESLVELPIVIHAENAQIKAFSGATSDLMHRFISSIEARESLPSVLLIVSTENMVEEYPVSLEMANSYCEAGYKTMLIVAQCVSTAAIDNIPVGLEEVLSKNLAYEVASIKCGLLSCIFCATKEGPSKKQLAGKAMEQLVIHCRKDFDRVILLSRPLSTSTDGYALSRYFDGIILILKSKVSRYSLLENALEDFNLRRAMILGAMILKSPPERLGRKILNSIFLLLK